MNPPDDQPQPPLLYDVVIPGEQVLANGGPWLHAEEQDGPGDTPPKPPFRAPASAASAPAQEAPTPGRSTETEGAATAAAPTAAQRAEIERHATRELARYLRSELERRLPEALREAEAPIRKAVDDALIDAVAASRRQQPSAQPPGGEDETRRAGEAETPNTKPSAPNR